MKKLSLLASLALLAVSCFSLVVFSYKHAHTALKIPKLEDECLHLKQEVTALELKLNALKTPQKLFEAKTKHASLKLKFPKKDDIYVVSSIKMELIKEPESKTALPSRLAIAKILP
jgi:cell division protein FtsL